MHNLPCCLSNFLLHKCFGTSLLQEVGGPIRLNGGMKENTVKDQVGGFKSDRAGPAAFSCGAG